METQTKQKDFIIVHRDKLEYLLCEILHKYRNQRICVVGTTGCGKTCFVNKHEHCRDMDAELFPLLGDEEKAAVCKTPWTPEIGALMDSFAKEKIIAQPEHPVFGTVLIDSDVIIYLNINSALLKERCRSRGVDIRDSFRMKADIEKELEQTEKPVIEIRY